MKNLNGLLLASVLVFVLTVPLSALPKDAYANGFGWYEFANNQINEPFEVAQNAQIIYVKGDVKVKKAQDGNYNKAKKNMSLNQSDQILVKGSSSLVEIRQRGGIIVSIKEGLNIETRRDTAFSMDLSFQM